MKDKLITFVIPCYNSENYMSNCIDSILQLNEEDIEIIIIDDGSKDNSAKIADEYENKYPNIIKAIHQENGGHGEGVNQGIKNASGLYFKVVDSDDWLDGNALRKLFDQIKIFAESGEFPDLILANYVYEYAKNNTVHIIDYNNIFPQNIMFSWNDIKRFKIGKYILMHSAVYRTEILRTSKVVLPKHTFYVDNIFVFEPLPYVKKIYYMDIDLYRYFIGREDQSVNEKVMLGRIDQQLKITRIMLDFYNENIKLISKEENLKKYMLKDLSIMLMICAVFLKMENTEESKRKLKELWKEIKLSNPELYKNIRHRSICSFTYLPKKTLLTGYKLARKIYKFN